MKIKDNTLVGTIYGITFLAHVALCYWVYQTGAPKLVYTLNNWFIESYEIIGFTWIKQSTLIITSGILSSVVLNTLRRILESSLLGWPRFSSHNIHSRLYSIIRGILYMFFVYISVGAFGELNSDQDYIGIFNVLYIAIGTYIFGIIVNVIDDTISALVITK